MPSAKDLIRAAPRYLGTPYSKLDCQAFVEACLKDIGINKNLHGSNAWYRTMTWVGSPKECKRYFGKVPIGAFLFILKHDDREPERYKSDRIGNASHIGIYTGLTGQEMAIVAAADGVENANKYNFGDGAVNSSSIHGCVCTSKFEGKSINGGWNRVGLWDVLSYDINLDSGSDKKMTGTIYAQSGSTVNMRVTPTTDAPLVERVPVGANVEVDGESENWYLIKYKGKKGYIMKSFVSFINAPDSNQQISGETVIVNKKELEAIYDKIGNWLGERG